MCGTNVIKHSRFNSIVFSIGSFAGGRERVAISVLVLIAFTLSFLLAVIPGLSIAEGGQEDS